jgi:hypothetical protein
MTYCVSDDMWTQVELLQHQSCRSLVFYGVVGGLFYRLFSVGSTTIVSVPDPVLFFSNCSWCTCVRTRRQQKRWKVTNDSVEFIWTIHIQSSSYGGRRLYGRMTITTRQVCRRRKFLCDLEEICRHIRCQWQCQKRERNTQGSSNMTMHLYRLVSTETRRRRLC